jgi:hypothetical protein
MLKDFMTRLNGAPRPSLQWPGRAACAKPAPSEVECSALLEAQS